MKQRKYQLGTHKRTIEKIMKSEGRERRAKCARAVKNYYGAAIWKIREPDSKAHILMCC